MKKHSFTLWLQSEVNSAKRVLLSLYEKYDQLVLIEHNKLKNIYYEHLCQLENKVIREEIEVELIKKKQEIIQSKLNRREKIDEAEIDALIEIERQILLGKKEMIEPAEVGGSFGISEQEESELQKLYHEIIAQFHPQLHPEMTKAQRELYDKAQQAYKMRDLDALKVIYDLLCSTQEDDFGFEITFNMESGFDLDDSVSVSTTDYALAEKIYNCFVKGADDAVLLEERARYMRLCEDVTEKMREKQNEFPFTIADILKDPVRLEEYKKELNERLHNAVFERDRREKEVRSLLESVVVHE